MGCSGGLWCLACEVTESVMFAEGTTIDWPDTCNGNPGTCTVVVVSDCTVVADNGMAASSSRIFEMGHTAES